MRRLPHPGQSTPNNAFVGHTGSSPPGVSGSPTHTTQQANPATTATPSGGLSDVRAFGRRVSSIGSFYEKELAPTTTVKIP